MSKPDVAQRSARVAQHKLNCAYTYALSIARSAEARKRAGKDGRPLRYREKLTDAILAIIQETPEKR